MVSTLTEIDGARLQMVAGGEAEWQPDHTSQELSRETIPAYYIETNPVSNSRYISFLNDIVSQISVRDSAVYFQDTVLVLLGEVREGYTPILYQEGKFIISAPQYSERPVVRVTAEGALAYAHYYNRDLPTPAPVSYTHLDVYKRQPLACLQLKFYRHGLQRFDGLWVSQGQCPLPWW